MILSIMNLLILFLRVLVYILAIMALIKYLKK